MKIEVFDIESFKHDWIVVFYNLKHKSFRVIHNDNSALLHHFKQNGNNTVYIGFNNKMYDDHLIRLMCSGATPELVNELSKYIVDGNSAFDFWAFNDPDRVIEYHPEIGYFHSADIKNDMQIGLGLKEIEGHLGLNIEETQVDFDIQRKLTPSELKSTIEYCKWDVLSTVKIVGLRRAYLKNKVHLGKLANIPPKTALGLTNAKLCARFLNANKNLPRLPAKDCSWAKGISTNNLPAALLSFFKPVNDLSETEMFSRKANIDIGGVAPTYAYGGVHYGKVYHFNAENTEYTIVNVDVASLYPNIMVLYNLLSAGVENPDKYKQTLKERIKAKNAGDKLMANTLKLVLNTTFGCAGNQYNDLYDPYSARSVCITGQILITKLMVSCLKLLDSPEMIQCNTDGVMFKIKSEQLPLFRTICKKWERETGLTLEEDIITAVWQKDVNNYIALYDNGQIKCKGAFVTNGIKNAGAWAINNNCCAISKALIEYFVNGKSPEQTILSNNNCLDFQIIAKAGHNYGKVKYFNGTELIPAQMTNRVYASKQPSLGSLYKYKKGSDKNALIPNLPKHCKIDNANQISIQEIDKSWYIDLAQKRINQFLGKEVQDGIFNNQLSI